MEQVPFIDPHSTSNLSNTPTHTSVVLRTLSFANRPSRMWTRVSRQRKSSATPLTVVSYFSFGIGPPGPAVRRTSAQKTDSLDPSGNTIHPGKQLSSKTGWSHPN